MASSPTHPQLHSLSYLPIKKHPHHILKPRTDSFYTTSSNPRRILMTTSQPPPPPPHNLTTTSSPMTIIITTRPWTLYTSLLYWTLELRDPTLHFIPLHFRAPTINFTPRPPQHILYNSIHRYYSLHYPYIPLDTLHSTPPQHFTPFSVHFFRREWVSRTKSLLSEFTSIAVWLAGGSVRLRSRTLQQKPKERREMERERERQS